MTTPIAQEVARRSGPRARACSLRQSLSYRLDAHLHELGSADVLSWPSPRYRANPVAFFREVLGVEPWSKQIEVIEAARDHKRVAIASGHKVSKSHTAGGLALWFYESFDDARVVMSSTTSRQVDQILWREVRMMKARAGRCAECKRRDAKGPRPCAHSAPIDGDIHELARSGLKALDFREIVGFTAREAEAVAGISGKNLLYIIDEASGIDDSIFEAIEGNRAGGARVIMFSNPTRTQGEFFEAFHGKSAFYKTIQISSEETPNVREGRIVIPGLATREWIDEKKAEWGEDSPLYKVRVKGEFVLREDGKILSVHTIGEAEARWAETTDDGPLQVGLDPAGPGLAGDESVFAVRRGKKCVRLIALRGQSDEAHIVHLLGILREERRQREEAALVVIDREGPIGGSLYGRLRAIADAQPHVMRVVGVRASDRAFRQQAVYDRVRDELWASLADWIRDGGAIPEDARLTKELHAPEWIQQVTGRLKVTPKEDLRKLLGRSPDRADALALAVWQTSSLGEDLPVPGPAPESDFTPPPVIDPYSGLDAFYGRGGR